MAPALYWLAIKLYEAAIRTAALTNPKAKLAISGRRDLLKRIDQALIDERRSRVWMHCASLGEFEQGRPVLEKLKKQYRNYAFVLTFFSPSGYEVRKNFDGVDYVFYLPFDSAYNASRFLRTVNPALCIFVKYEFWYYYLSEITSKNIPCVLISAIFRESQPFFKWYGHLHRKMLHAFLQIFVQDNESVQLLKKLGIQSVSPAGDTRFDRVVEAVAQQQSFPIAEAFCNNYKVIVAGSTWSEDERLLHKLISAIPSHWRLILAPHEIDEGHINKIEGLFEGMCTKWTDWNGDTGKRVLLVNKVGMLMQLYRYADVAWVGGGFGKDGVHNVLEPAVYGIPVVFGPVYHQFLEAKELLDVGGAFVVNNEDELKRLVFQWDKDSSRYQRTCSAAKHFVLTHAGATQKILDYLDAKKLLKVL